MNKNLPNFKWQEAFLLARCIPAACARNVAVHNWAVMVKAAIALQAAARGDAK